MRTRKYRDKMGDTWTALPDGRLMWDDSAEYREPLVESREDVERQYGPLTSINNGATLSATYLDESGKYSWCAPFTAESAQSCPGYYLLPNGVEVKAVARYLTSNAGQAVQYIARSSRLDGNNKGDRVGDLRKAVDMMLDEIERLEAEQDAA